MGRYLVCVTGASGAVYGLRVIRALVEGGHEAHAIVSAWGERVVLEETGRKAAHWFSEFGLPAERVHNPADLTAPPASGTFRLDGTCIAPCSMATVGALASGSARNLVQRAGAVALKEGRTLVLATRETPLSLIDLRNLATLAEAGAAILPASPGFYHRPKTIDDLVDFVAGKVLDRLGVDHELFARWTGSPSYGQD